MNWRNNAERYGSLSIGLHWLMLMLFVAVYACVELHESFPKGSYMREALLSWHYTLGLSVFALVWLRIAANLSGLTPRIEPEPPDWQLLSARLVHLALYVLMVALPLIGWLVLSARGKQIPFFNLQLPALVGESKAWGSFSRKYMKPQAHSATFS
jgi:cytochrome b561